MRSPSQHTHRALKRLKQPLHALHGAIAANSATDVLAPSVATPEIDVENLAATFVGDSAPVAANSSAADGFVLIAPKGSWSHSVGLQVVDDQAVGSMVSRFHGAFARVARFLGSAAVPVYRGHPDDAQFGDDHEDTTRYGEIRELQARPDGLYARIEWTVAGNALLQSGAKLYFSPRWLMRGTRPMTGQPTYRPHKLLSVGLTPTPNIAGAAANEQQPQKTHDMNLSLLKKLLAALGFSEAQAAAAAANEATAPTEADVVGAVDKLKSDLSAANAAKAKADGDLVAANEAKAKTEADLATANAKLTEVTTAANAKAQGIAKVIVTQAIKVGVITAANEQSETDLLLGHSDFAAAANALLDRTPVINTTPHVSAAARTGEGVASAANVAAVAFEGKVTEIAANEKISRNDAWSRAKTLHADLFAAMNDKPVAQ